MLGAAAWARAGAPLGRARWGAASGRRNAQAGTQAVARRRRTGTQAANQRASWDTAGVLVAAWMTAAAALGSPKAEVIHSRRSSNGRFVNS